MSTFQPHTFGKYVLVDHVATGGMAEIFKAKTFSHGGFENLLVIKRILPHIGEKPDFVEMFIDEAKISVALQHPNIVRIYDFGKVSLPEAGPGQRLVDHYYIAMECVEGKDVRQLLRQLARDQAWLPDRFSAFIAFETCKGLHYAHTKCDLDGQPYGVVHRDISPSNVLLSYEGEVKVADFGIAKAESNAYETRDGVLKGKFEYMSPEQASGEPIDGRSDVFSLGIVLYEMATGRRLFKTDSDVETLKLIRDHDVMPPSQLKADIAPALERIILKALSRDRSLRYASAQAMADDLREFLFPATTDVLKDELRTYLHEVFASDIVEERARLRDRAALAATLRDQTEWDGNTHSTMSQGSQNAVKLVVPTVALGSLLLLGLLGVAGVGAYLGRDQLAALFVEQPTTGTVDMLVVPDAVFLVDGVERGRGGSLSVAGLAPGEHFVAFQAEGYLGVQRTIRVEAGQTVRLTERLEALPEEAPVPAPVVAPVPEEPTGPPRLSLRSEPPGAEVFVDGVSLGTTPTSFTASEGGSYRIEMRLEGRQAASTSVSGLAEGERRTVSLSLPEAAQPAKLVVVLTGGGWAHVYVDGEKLGKTAPLRDVPLPAGPHEIRVVNEALGIDHTETVQAGAGQAVTVRAAPK